MSFLMITLTLPDGKTRQVAVKTTCMDVAKSISEGLARECVAAKVDDMVVDMSTPLTKDCRFKLLKFADKEGMEVFRHSCAHLLAHAVRELFPKAKPTIGPVVEEGFYYDFDTAPFTPEDLEKIDAKMKEICDRKLPVSRVEMNEKQALETFKDNAYKVEIIKSKEGSEVGTVITAYQQGDFIDLCRGPHVPNTGMLKSVKILKLAAAYWRGDQKNKQLQRIYAIGFPEKKQLQEHLDMLEEAKKRDHRKIGKDLELFHISEEIGPGLVLCQRRT
jgi:threonyl-tRNA synthetase